MSCYYHPNKEDVATCPQCGKKLCRDCFEITSPLHICSDCAILSLNVEKKYFIKQIIFGIISIITCIVGLVLMGGEKSGVGLALWFIGGFVPGYQLLGKFFGSHPDAYVENGKVYDNRVGSVIGFIIHCILTIFISPFMVIIGIIKIISSFFQYKKSKAIVNILEESKIDFDTPIGEMTTDDPFEER